MGLETTPTPHIFEFFFRRGGVGGNAKMDLRGFRPGFAGFTRAWGTEVPSGERKLMRQDSKSPIARRFALRQV